MNTQHLTIERRLGLEPKRWFKLAGLYRDDTGMVLTMFGPRHASVQEMRVFDAERQNAVVEAKP